MLPISIIRQQSIGNNICQPKVSTSYKHLCILTILEAHSPLPKKMISCSPVTCKFPFSPIIRKVRHPQKSQKSISSPLLSQRSEYHDGVEVLVLAILHLHFKVHISADCSLFLNIACSDYNHEILEPKVVLHPMHCCKKFTILYLLKTTMIYLE